jgi:hypothetical protein
MKKTGISILAIVTLALISGCNESEQTSDTAQSKIVSQPASQNPAEDTRTASEIIEYAKNLQEKALHLGHAWRTTQDHISEAEKLLGLNERDSARVSALRAELSASASIAQSQNEQSAWQGRFPK